MSGTTRRHARRPPGWFNRMVLALLRSPAHGIVDPGLCELRYVADSTGRIVALPVLYAVDGTRFVVLVGDAENKRWWRHFRHPAPVEVRRGGQRLSGTGRVVELPDPDYPVAWKTYLDRHHVPRESTDRLLVIDTARADR